MQLPVTNDNSPTFGFLCPESNTFYAFETFEEYQLFLNWMNEQRQSEEMEEQI